MIVCVVFRVLAIMEGPSQDVHEGTNSECAEWWSKRLENKTLHQNDNHDNNHCARETESVIVVRRWHHLCSCKRSEKHLPCPVRSSLGGSFSFRYLSFRFCKFRYSVRNRKWSAPVGASLSSDVLSSGQRHEHQRDERVKADREYEYEYEYRQFG